MKKRFVSFMLVMAMALGLVSSGFAAGVPDDSGPMRDPNRYYYTYETKPWGKEVELTVSETEAKVKDKIKEKISSALVDAFSSQVPEFKGKELATDIAKDFVENIYAQEPFARAGTYKIKNEMKYKYRVDRLDKTKRHIETEWLVSHYDLYQNGTLVDSYSRQLIMK